MPGPANAGPGAAADSARGWFATATHCRALAERILAALPDSHCLVVVTGDPAPDAARLAPALAAAGWRVVARTGAPELSMAALRQAAASGLAGDAGAGPLVARLRPPPPLFLLDRAERLPEPLLAELLTPRPAEEAVFVLLGGAGFSRRLAAQAAAGQHPIGSLRADRLSEAETGDFIRHQLGPAGDFPPEIVGVIAKAAGGDPALVERLARLVLGFAAGGGEMPAASLLLRPAGLAAAPTAAEAAAPALVAAGQQLRRTLYAGLALTAGLAVAAAAFLGRTAPDGGEAQPAIIAIQPADEIATLLRRGDGFRDAGDIASARLFYERAAVAGSAGAARRLGDSFDPARLARAGVRGVGGDPDRASFWYRRAAALGDAAAAERLAHLAAPNRQSR